MSNEDFNSPCSVLHTPNPIPAGHLQGVGRERKPAAEAQLPGCQEGTAGIQVLSGESTVSTALAHNDMSSETSGRLALVPRERATEQRHLLEDIFSVTHLPRLSEQERSSEEKLHTPASS